MSLKGLTAPPFTSVVTKLELYKRSSHVDTLDRYCIYWIFKHLPWNIPPDWRKLQTCCLARFGGKSSRPMKANERTSQIRVTNWGECTIQYLMQKHNTVILEKPGRTWTYANCSHIWEDNSICVQTKIPSFIQSTVIKNDLSISRSSNISAIIISSFTAVSHHSICRSIRPLDIELRVVCCVCV